MQTLQKSPDLAEIRNLEVYIGALDLSFYMLDLLFSRVGGTWLLVMKENLPTAKQEDLRLLCALQAPYPVYLGIENEIEDTRGISWFYHFFKTQYPARKLRARYALPESGFYGSYYFLEGCFLYGRARDSEIPF